MKEICDTLKSSVDEVIAVWDDLVRREPWYSLPSEHRVDNLVNVVLGLVESSLCNPVDERTHWQNIQAATEHGSHRRAQGIPDALIHTEYHLLRHALWSFLVERIGASPQTADAIMRIDTAITVATNASMWGYHREEIEAMGKWEEGMQRILRSSPLLVTRQDG